MASKKRPLRVVQLYPRQMNIYGDNGNAQIICRRAELYGYDVELGAYNSIDDSKTLLSADIVLGGGGQDSGQRAIVNDLAKIKPELLRLAEDKVPMLMICGMYQLFGHYFETNQGDRLNGIGLFDMVTVGGDKRLIGNIVISNDQFGEILGYENHSGMTELGNSQSALGVVVSGYGNDSNGLNEGAIRYRTVGSYLHGPILAKNPKLADWIIVGAVERAFSDSKLRVANEQCGKELAMLDESIKSARKVAKSRPQ